MRSLLFLAFVVASARGCGVPTFPPVLSRVVNGEDVRPHSWPWQISLQSGRYGHWSHACGGTLISAEWVITAAHCLSDKNSYRVQLGKHSLETADEEGSVTMSVSKIIKHGQYNAMLSRNDIAMLKLSSPVTFTDTIKPGCLPEDGAILPHSASCYVTGWGRLTTEGPGADIMQQALLPVVSYEVCSQSDWWSFLMTKDMVCAGDGIKSACMGDSGGPLNCQNPDGSWDVHGVVSFGSGQGCNVVQKPTVFTKVTSYIDWINTIMSSH